MTLRARAIDLYLGDGVRSAARGLRRVARAVRGGERRATFFFRVDDPQSHLVALLLPRLASAASMHVELVAVPAPAADVDPEPEKKAAFDVADARRVAAALGLPFPEPGHEPHVARVRMANAILLAPRSNEELLALAPRVSDALLRRDGDALAALATAEGTVAGQDLRPALEANYARLRHSGHYQPSVVAYEGEHYVGADRLVFLEERLRAEGALEAPVLPRLPDEVLGPASAGRTVEVFFSFRSPYSFLALERLVRFRDEHGVIVRLRPVLPLVMRGVQVPPTKRLYIAKDARREAARRGIRFGRIADPLAAAERCLAVFPYAEQRGVGLEFALEAGRAAFAEGLELGDDAGLCAVAARVGLDADLVKQALTDEGWRAVVEKNREELYELGLFGVPSFRVGDFATFGQDRLFLVAERLSRP